MMKDSILNFDGGKYDGDYGDTALKIVDGIEIVPDATRVWTGICN